MRKQLTNPISLIVFSGSLFALASTAFGIPGQSSNSAPSGARAALTNADVIRMEQAVLTTIRSRPVRFDLSPTALAALRRAGVSELILNAMEQAERQAQAKPPVKGHQPSKFDAVTLQRGVTQDTGFEKWANSSHATRAARSGTVAGPPPQKPTPQQINAMMAKLGGGPSGAGSTVNNPAAGRADAALVSLLRQQKQTALAERGKAPPPGGQPSNPNFARVSSARPAFPGGKTSPSATGSSLANRVAIRGQPDSVLTCAAFNTPVIQSVSGQRGNTAIFSQDPKFNPFTIKGCNFGNVAGRAQLNYANGGKLADLRIDSWAENSITVELSPSLVNVLDQKNVTLILFPANKPQGKRSGYKFYAMRREMRLTSIPRARSTTRVDVTNDDSGRRVNLNYSSPYRGLAYPLAIQTGTPIAQVSPNVDQGWTAGVDRINEVRFPGGTDLYSFDGLKPGFILEKFRIDERTIAVCHAGALYYIGATLEGGVPFVGNFTDLTNAASSKGVTYYSDGKWNASIEQNSIRVNWAEGHCHATDGNDSSNSSYALNVWVVGPALGPGISPWQDGAH